MKASICYPKYIKIQNGKTFCKSSRWWIRRAVNAHSLWTEMHFELLIEYTCYWCTRTAVVVIIENYQQFIFHSIRNVKYGIITWIKWYIFIFMYHGSSYINIRDIGQTFTIYNHFTKMIHHQENKMRVIFETINIA